MTEGFPGSLVVKIPPANARVVALSPGSGRSLGEGNGNPLQYSCLESSMNRGAWCATIHEVAESGTTEHTCKTMTERIPLRGVKYGI